MHPSLSLKSISFQHLNLLVRAVNKSAARSVRVYYTQSCQQASSYASPCLSLLPWGKKWKLYLNWKQCHGNNKTCITLLTTSNNCTQRIQTRVGRTLYLFYTKNKSGSYHQQCRELWCHAINNPGLVLLNEMWCVGYSEPSIGISTGEVG